MKTQSVNDRVNSYRHRLRAAGFRPLQIWVPDAKKPGFAAECQRQSLIIQSDQGDQRDLELLAEIAAWDES